MIIEGTMLHGECNGTGFVEENGVTKVCIGCMGSGMATGEVEIEVEGEMTK